MVQVENENKRSHEDDVEEEAENAEAKKAKTFSAKEFRQQLKTEQKITALQDFIASCKNDKAQNCVKDYIEHGGSCLELMELLEGSDIPQVVILQCVTYVLLRVIANYRQQYSNAHEACRYLLNTHIMMINKMLGLTSSGKERLCVLKLLTAIVMFSPNLARDILLHVNFHSGNLEVLTKHTPGGAESVREAFVHFLVSFLVDGHYPTISLLLEKPGLLPSIAHGLRFDSSKTVCVVISIFKEKILENFQVMKTVKMRTFSTPVVKDIVNLYNWRGPRGAVQNKNNTAGEVDEIEKSKVSQNVHSFLLTLCTSNRFGVIFKDKTLGMGKKHQNPLMFTVLESLDRPWEHSYAGELVTKICGACPDLAKTMWANLKPFLEPRPTLQWLKAVKFAKMLLQELKPECVQFCVKEFNVNQFAQMVQFMVAPTAILKTIIPEKFVFDSHSTKHEVLVLLQDMLQAITSYLEFAKSNFPTNFNRSLKDVLHDHVARNFPNAQAIFNDWNQDSMNPTENFPQHTQADHMDVILNILRIYCVVCPQQLDTFSINLDIPHLLEQIANLQDENSTALQIKLVKVFITYDSSLFTANCKTFASVAPLMLQTYFEKHDESSRATLKLILKNTGIFDGCESEIGLWINGVFNVKNCDEEIGRFFVKILSMSYENSSEYMNEINKLKKLTEYSITNLSSEEVMEILLSDNQLSPNSYIKHTIFSPLLLAAFQYFDTETASKNLKYYFHFVLLNIFHNQTDYGIFKLLLEKNRHIIPSALFNYVNSWDDNPKPLEKFKGKLDIFPTLSRTILNGDKIDIKSINSDIYPNLHVDLLKMVVFHVLHSRDNLNEAVYNTCLELTKAIIGNKFSVVLTHPLLLESFSPLHNKKDHKYLCTQFLIEIVKLLPQQEISLLKSHQAKLFSSILKLLRKNKSSKIEKLVDIIKVVGLEFSQCSEILTRLSEIDASYLNETSITGICNYALNEYVASDNLQPLPSNVVANLASHLTFINNSKGDSEEFTGLLAKYLEKFPHNQQEVNRDLFESILQKDFCKGNSELATIILKNRTCFLDVFENNLEIIVTKKGLFLPLLDCVPTSSGFLEKAYKIFEHSILKALQKPQKACQYFEKYHGGVCSLIGNFMPEETAKAYLDKIQKFDVCEVFHAKFLKVLYEKFSKSEKRVNNAIMTFVHLLIGLFKRNTKTDSDWEKIKIVTKLFFELTESFPRDEISLEQVQSNEAFKLFTKFCLKFGVTQEESLLELIVLFVKVLKYKSEEAEELLEMIIAHSEFMDLILSEDSNRKKRVLELLLAICTRFPEAMKRDHIAVLLGSYSATLNSSDQIILQLLKLLESSAAQTNFYDFKPFLWGVAARNHYTIKMDIQKSLWRQPKTGDVLNILNESWVRNTIKLYPLNSSLKYENLQPCTKPVYDLRFLLPLFSHLLAPENNVQTYRFSKSGALSLTLVALSCDDEDVRKAACHVLYRFHCHLESRKFGKDNLLWLRFIEAVCRGTAIFEDFKLNNFVAIFFARMALILTKPQDVMYVPLCYYLGAKSTPNLSSIPELYTFLHSSDVNFKEHRYFILEILRDGLRTDKDFDVFARSMAYKLLMEIYTSVIADNETKIFILQVFKNACILKHGAQLLCNSYGLLSWLLDVVNTNDNQILLLVLQILQNILDNKLKDFLVVELLFSNIINSNLQVNLKREVFLCLLKCLNVLFDSRKEFFSENRLRTIINYADNKECRYMMDFKCKLSCGADDDTIDYYLKFLTSKWLSNK